MALIFILKRYKKAYYNVKKNVFNDLFCEKKSLILKIIQIVIANTLLNVVFV